ncbi:MAG: Deoxyguanosinetriphosphate triphosphohydrolase-like protein [Turneriella sp.]|nr:Deoxyguanosinetriphosphate triphosphohydrolase-like protein [Turneriella sp.]
MLSPLAAQGPLFESRRFVEKPHPLRNEFQRDRDRVVHSKFFRRLEYKTQVFVNHLGDNFRTRLTHSIEVAQISRTVARALLLNEDLTETVALAHDLGHPPFGHAGERTLHEKMREHGGFDHNEQTLRIVTELEERYPEFKGLNLTEGTLSSLQKHKTQPHDFKNAPDNSRRGHCLEALIVDVCDEIAYNNHDIDDGLESGYLSQEMLDGVEIWRIHFIEAKNKYPHAKNKILIRTTIRTMINSMVVDLINASKRAIDAARVKNIEEVVGYTAIRENPPLITFSGLMDKRVKELKHFLFRNLYRHADVVRMNERAALVLSRIYDFIAADPKMLPRDFYERTEEESRPRVIADFIAGMTDRYALEWNHDILGIH